jgi:hypothetical protein
MKGLSDWQSARVRDALRAYHRYERGAEGEFFTWKDVREAIAVYTDIEIGTSSKNGAERLRQFVEGVTDKKNPDQIKYPVPQPSAIEAIVEFVTHEELNLLSEDELNEYVPDFQAHQRLLEYLYDGSETARMIPPENLQGAYKMSGERNAFYFVRELTLQRRTDQGLIQIIETEDRYSSRPEYNNFGEWDLSTRRKVHKSRERHGGWAILAPEDNLLFFLKNEENARNRYYITMAADVGLWSGAPHNRLVVLQHDYPFELEQGEFSSFITEKEIVHVMKGKMHFFKKVKEVLQGEAVKATVIDFPVKKDDD